MRGGFLPPAILCASLALALSFVGWRLALIGAAIMAAVAVAAFALHPPLDWMGPIFVVTWFSVIANAAITQVAGRLNRRWFLAAAVNTGLWAGLVSAVAVTRHDLAVALPAVLLFVIGVPLVERGWGIAVKVVASWLAAVAILATMLSLVPTPGYMPDHME